MISHIDASLSRQPLVKGERLVRYEVNAVMSVLLRYRQTVSAGLVCRCFLHSIVVCWGKLVIIYFGIILHLMCMPKLSIVGRSSQADYLMRNVAMDDSIGGS